MNQLQRNESILKAVIYELRIFADSLVPSEEFQRVSKKAFETVSESIKQDPAFSVNHCIIAGSYGKKTWVLIPDIDAVIFINKKELPLTDEIDAIVDLLESKAKEFGIIPNSITKSSKTVKIKFYSGVEMDLLPACTFSQDPYEQYSKVLEHIKSFPENYFMFSSSLADIQVQFLKTQDSPTHQLIRLLKYWYKSLTLDVEIYGGSYLLEILCVVVCKETRTQKSLIENFKAALQKVAKIDTLRVAFRVVYYNKKFSWSLLSESQLEEHKDEFSPFILKRDRFIIDPSNPYNDLFNPKNLTEKVVTKLKVCAKEMLLRVEMLDSIDSNELKNVTNTNSDIDVKLYIDKIFEPHSMPLRDKYDELGIPDEIVCHLDFKCKDISKLKPIEPSNPTFFVDNKEAKKVSKTISNNLLFLVRAKARLYDNGLKGEDRKKKYIFKSGIPDVLHVDDVKATVETFSAQNSFKVQYSSSKKDHEKCDVKLHVPYVCNGEDLALRFSMKYTKKLGKDNNNLVSMNWCVFRKVALASLAMGVITATLMVSGATSLFLRY